jgi:hypothetical protein
MRLVRANVDVERRDAGLEWRDEESSALIIISKLNHASNEDFSHTHTHTRVQ